MTQAIVAGISSGIGRAVTESFLQLGWDVAGTLRRDETNSRLADRGLQLTTNCDFGSEASVDRAVKEITSSTRPWSVLVVLPGTMKPIGPFEGVDFNDWAESVSINLINQLRFVHGLLGHAKSDGNAKCVFFAGGGTNSAPRSFSAYVLSKVALIKATELLDAENLGVTFSILGPGWVETKIHQQTLEEVGSPTEVVLETQRRLSEKDFVEMNQVISFLHWIIGQPKDVVGGRNFAVKSDPIHSERFVEVLKSDSSIYKLRRFGNSFDWSLQ